ncbi:hypothetical protein [Arthrobacter sp. CAL618]|uniref:hypothetical protein n=1 Tax=Arthrobacter sp. CAL618 TaxID=1055770 RepID=UPI00307BE169
MRRAALAAEFALAQWLVRGVAMNNSEMITEAEDMMSTLDRDLQAEEAAAAAYRAQQSQHQPDTTIADTNGADTDSADNNGLDNNGADGEVAEPALPIDDHSVAGETIEDDGGDTSGFDDGDPGTGTGAESPDTDRDAGSESANTTENPRPFSVSPVPADDTETSSLPIIKSS